MFLLFVTAEIIQIPVTPVDLTRCTFLSEIPPIATINNFDIGKFSYKQHKIKISVVSVPIFHTIDLAIPATSCISSVA